MDDDINEELKKAEADLERTRSGYRSVRRLLGGLFEQIPLIGTLPHEEIADTGTGTPASPINDKLDINAPAEARWLYGDVKALPEKPPRYSEPKQQRKIVAKYLSKYLSSPVLLYPVLSVCGLSGIGKTTLVAEALRVKGVAASFEFCVWLNAMRYKGTAHPEVLLPEIGIILSDFLQEANPTFTRVNDRVPVEPVAAAKGLIVIDNFEVLMGHDDRYTGDSYLWNLIRACHARHAAGKNGLKILLICWKPPSDLEPQGMSLIDAVLLEEGLQDEQMRSLLRFAQRQGSSIFKQALTEAKEQTKNDLIRLCSGNPAALNAMLSVLKMKAIERSAEGVENVLEDLLEEPVIRETLGDDLNLARFVEWGLERVAARPERRAVLLALAQLRLPAKAQDRSDGVPSVAIALLPSLTLAQVRSALAELSPGFVNSIRDKSSKTTRYRISPTFEGEIIRYLLGQNEHDRTVLMRATADYYQGLLAGLPDHLRADGLTEAYRYEHPDYKAWVIEWLRSRLGDPERGNDALVGIAAVVLQLHWWWALFVRWDVYDDVLERVGTALKFAARVLPQADFRLEQRLLERLLEFDSYYPKQRDWATEPDPMRCDRVAHALQEVRRILDCDFSSSQEGQKPEFPVLKGELRNVAAIIDMYLGDLTVMRWRCPGSDPGLLADAAHYYESARERFTKKPSLPGCVEVSRADMEWSLLYVIASQTEVAFRSDKRENALRFAHEGLERCRVSDYQIAHALKGEVKFGDIEAEEADAKATLYQTLANGLWEKDPEVAAKCLLMTVWEAFLYLWYPITNPPNDDYTISFYEVTAERFSYMIRQWASRADCCVIAEKALQTSRDFWGSWQVEHCGQRLDRSDEELSGGASLLRGWQRDEKKKITRGNSERQAIEDKPEWPPLCYAPLIKWALPLPPPRSGDEAGIRYRDAAKEHYMRQSEKANVWRDEIISFVNASLISDKVVE